jgi:hypothetical protein
MAAASFAKMQWIRTSILIVYPRSAGAPSQRPPHHAPSQHYSQHSEKHSEKPRKSPSPSIHDDAAELPGTSQAKSTERLHGKSTGKRDPPPPEQTSEMMVTEVRVLKAELAKARGDAAAAVALAAEREPSGLGGSVD